MPSSNCNADSVYIVSEYTIVPDSKSSIDSLRLSVSDLPMLTFQYIQKGCLFSGHPNSLPSFLSLLKLSLSKTLSVFPPLAGRLSTDPTTGHVSIACSDAGALLVHARATSVSLDDILCPSDTPAVVRQFFALEDILSYDGHSSPLAAVQATELADGVFIGCSVNHAVVDGTSFWKFFNTLAEISRGAANVSRPPCFSRDNVFRTDTTLRLAGVSPLATISGEGLIRERIFHFSRQSLLALKRNANEPLKDNGESTAEISSFQSLCAHLWRSVTRARNLPLTKTTTFSLAVNCRHRVDPKMDPLYFGNAIQIIPTVALAGEVVSRELGWSADLLHRNVAAHDDRTVRKGVEAWEQDPQCVRLGKVSDGASIIIGSSPRFPMYDNDFGWGRPVAVRSGKANKVDGHMSAFPGRVGDGSVDFEVLLAPATMACLEHDPEFMKYVG